jgi:hypothetical protein
MIPVKFIATSVDISYVKVVLKLKNNTVPSLDVKLR